jgi:polyisoprenoid-binding protein YceI
MLGRFLLATLVLGGVTLVPRRPAPVPADGANGRFSIDPVHSNVIFKIRHMGVSNFYGRFDSVKGTILVDAEKPEESMVRFEIDAAKIDTNDAKRDAHLRSPDFFNVDQFKTIEFESTLIEEKDKGALEVTGDLTMHGVKRSVTATVTPVGYAKVPQMGERVGYETRFAVKRSDFGMKGFLENGALGDDIDVIVSIEAGK